MGFVIDGGQVAERLNAPVSKTGSRLVRDVGSNPTLSVGKKAISHQPSAISHQPPATRGELWDGAVSHSHVTDCAGTGILDLWRAGM